MDLELLTNRLRLRPLRLDDLDLSIEMFTNPEVVRYVGDLQTAETIREEMPKYVKRCGRGCIGIWCVTDKESSEKIGTGALLPMPIDEDDTDWDLIEGTAIPDCEIEVGYILKPSAWGKGYATEICDRLLSFAFEKTPLEAVVACIDENNDKSRNVLHKCGFLEEGRRRAYGEYPPCFRITQEQWESENLIRKNIRNLYK
ncbi:MAG: GNAT family N-acetyltransferase [bacterium]